MRYVKYLALLTVLMVPLAYSQAQVRVAVGVGIGGVGVAVGPAYAAGPPVCSYGYYSYYPYACAPYGFYGPSYFVNGIFIGAGPWYHWGHPAWFWNRGYYGGPGYWGRGWAGHPAWGDGHGEFNRGFHGYSGGGFHGGEAFHGGGEFHASSGFHGGSAFHGGGGFHGGRR